MDKPAYNVEEATYFPTYSIIPINDVHLRVGKVLHKNSPLIIEEPAEQGEQPETPHSKNKSQKGKIVITQIPPYPKRLLE